MLVLLLLVLQLQFQQYRKLCYLPFLLTCKLNTGLLHLLLFPTHLRRMVHIHMLLMVKALIHLLRLIIMGMVNHHHHNNNNKDIRVNTNSSSSNNNNNHLLDILDIHQRMVAKEYLINRHLRYRHLHLL